MNLTRSLVPLCLAGSMVLCLSLVACGEAAVESPQSAHALRSEPPPAGPATVVSVPEPSPEVVEQGQGASDDEDVPTNSVASRLASYAGEFRGELLSTNEMVPALTQLRWRHGALTGSYTFGRELDERGTLRDCSEPEPEVVHCEWRDEYGTGLLKLHFSSDTSYFEGEWSPEDEPALSHPWTGMRIGGMGEAEPGPDESEPVGD